MVADDTQEGDKEPNEALHWYAVRVIVRFGISEGPKSPRQIIEARGYRTFNPMYSYAGRRPRARSYEPRKLIRKQVLPGYLFVGMPPAGGNWLTLRNLPCVCGVVGIGTEPVRIPWSRIKDLAERAERGEFEPRAPKHDPLRKGEEVRIYDGVFRGYKTRIQKIKNGRAAMVLLNLLGTEKAVEIELDNLRRIAT